MHKAIDTCPKQPQKMIHRILCVVYKNELPMSDRVFGLDEQVGEKTKKRQAQISPKDSRLAYIILVYDRYKYIGVYRSARSRVFQPLLFRKTYRWGQTSIPPPGEEVHSVKL